MGYTFTRSWKKKWSVPTNRSIMNLVLHMDDSMHDSFGNSCQEALCSCCAMAKKRKVGTSYIDDIDQWCKKMNSTFMYSY